MKKKLVGVALAGVLMLTAGCVKVPKLENGQDKLASIDGYNISVDDLYAELKTQGGMSVTINMIDKFIINKEITDQKGADSYADGQIAMYEEYYGDDFEKTLTSYGYSSVDNFKETIKLNYLKEKVALNYIKTTVTEEETKKYYDEKIYGDLTVRYILVKPAELDSSASDEDKLKAKSEALTKAKELIKKINAGEKFEDIAKANSADTLTAANGGLLSGFNKDQVDEAFFKAAVALKDGKMTTEPIEDTKGYNIILKVSTAEKPALDKVKDDILETLAEEKLNADEKAYNNAWYQIRKNYKFTIVDTEINTLYEANYGK